MIQNIDSNFFHLKVLKHFEYCHRSWDQNFCASDEVFGVLGHIDLNLSMNTQMINNKDLNKYLIYSSVIKASGIIMTGSQHSCRPQTITSKISKETVVYDTNINYYCYYYTYMLLRQFLREISFALLTIIATLELHCSDFNSL